jgi:hypothetical protein
VGVEGPPALEEGLSLLNGLLPLREASGNTSEPLAEAGLEVKVQSQLPAFLGDNSKPFHTYDKREFQNSGFGP